MLLFFALFKVAFTNFRGYLNLKCLYKLCRFLVNFIRDIFSSKSSNPSTWFLAKQAGLFGITPPAQLVGSCWRKEGNEVGGEGGRVSDRPLANELKRGRRWEKKKEEGEMEEKAQQPKHRKRRRKI